MKTEKWGVFDSDEGGARLDSGLGLENTYFALLIESSGGAGPVKLRQPDPIFGWGC